MTLSSQTPRDAVRGSLAKLRGMLRSARTREVDALVAQLVAGRLSDAAERELTERLLHRGDLFRL